MGGVALIFAGTWQSLVRGIWGVYQGCRLIERLGEERQSLEIFQESFGLVYSPPKIAARSSLWPRVKSASGELIFVIPLLKTSWMLPTSLIIFDRYRAVS